MQILVVARIKAGISIDQVLPLVGPEAAKAWEYYANSQIRQMYYIEDMSGAVMIWEGESVEAVTAAAQKLPMYEGGVLELEVLPLKPYTGFASLFAQS